MAILKQSTAYDRAFFMVLSSDHVAPATSKTVTVALSKSSAGVPQAFANASNATATEVGGAGNGNGWYYVTLLAADTSGAGDLAFHCTAAGCDNTDFVDQVQTQIFTDLSLAGNGRVNITTNFQQNSAITAYPFFLTQVSTNAPFPGQLANLVGQRSLGAGGFAGLASPGFTELGNGWYTLNLQAADTNSANVAIKISCNGANDTDFTLTFQP